MKLACPPPVNLRYLRDKLNQSETLFVNIQRNFTNARCNRTSPFILVSMMVPYTFAKTAIFMASLQIIQNWNAPLI